MPRTRRITQIATGRKVDIRRSVTLLTKRMKGPVTFAETLVSRSWISVAPWALLLLTVAVSGETVLAQTPPASAAPAVSSTSGQALSPAMPSASSPSQSAQPEVPKPANASRGPAQAAPKTLELTDFQQFVA